MLMFLFLLKILKLKNSGNYLVHKIFNIYKFRKIVCILKKNTHTYKYINKQLNK